LPVRDSQDWTVIASLVNIDLYNKKIIIWNVFYSVEN